MDADLSHLFTFTLSHIVQHFQYVLTELLFSAKINTPLIGRYTEHEISIHVLSS